MDARHGCSSARRTPEPQSSTRNSPSSSTTALPETGRQKALLIGICGSSIESEEYPVLKGSHRDVASVRDLLIDCYDYKLSDITTLIDDGVPEHTQPTRANIFRAIADLVEDAKEGDHFCFHYCGHSTQVENRRNSEEDGKDECIIPSDGECNRILDNELNDALVVPLPSGSHLVAVLDTCHSGSLLDLKHNRCNRVHVPWRWRGRRGSEEIRHKVVRNNARLFSPSRAAASLAGRKTAPPARHASTRLLARRSEINMNLVCSPPEAYAAGTGEGARQRTFTYRSRTVDYAPCKNENLAGDELPALRGEFFLAEEDHRCESPVAMFECTGWCRDGDKSGRGDAEPSAGGIRADVVSLSSCKDSQTTWEDDEGKSMTSALVQILRRNPNQSLKEVLVHISHAMYTKTLVRPAQAWKFKAERTKLIVACQQEIEQGTKQLRSMSLMGAEAGPALAGASTFPAPRSRTIVARLERLKQLVIELRNSAGCEMNAFENPELSSTRPLDMERQWRM
ncbi:caspase domain-containing protein [Mycena rosella]|uniref:Caspase domain-containing protein n=1 Tax=Mycena rosella TaxID=1033263 RepID=A0AAD7G6I4_MYCRO|nr:caspase domain-containing protein [Mycena rosella]